MTELKNELIRHSAADLAAKLAAREVSAVEVTQAHLDRIADVDGQINAFLHVNTEEALAVAAEVDAARRWWRRGRRTSCPGRCADRG